MIYAVALVLAYLIGSIPTGYILVHLLKGFDVRTIGSKRTGATNVIRAAGWGAGIAVFVGDMAKGAAAICLGRWLVTTSWLGAPGASWDNWRSLLVGLGSGLLAVVGHNWPIYLSFRGGRGVAATFGSVLALAPWAAVGAFLMAVVVVLRWRWVSLGSIVGSNLLAVGLLAYGALAKMPIWAALYGLVLGIMVTATHKDNIQRLLAGTERRLGDRVGRGPTEEGS
jgi:glycerol-3-phosphate acyltransferase PlsY